MSIIALSFNFIWGLIIGSFLNVVAVRYREDSPLFDRKILGGRSRCDQCSRQLTWHELIPVLSFVVQVGRCRGCKKRISWQYPIVELLTAFAFLIPYYTGLSYWWVAVAVLMILLSFIDLRLMIIPDEINAALLGLGVVIAFVGNNSFMGPYFVLFPFLGNGTFLSFVVGGVLGCALLLFAFVASRGKAMGMGDVKFAGVMGVLLGFPDILFALAFGFVVGGVWSAFLLLFHRTALKTMVPFGPFLVLGFWLHIFFTENFLRWYFSLI